MSASGLAERGGPEAVDTRTGWSGRGLGGSGGVSRQFLCSTEAAVLRPDLPSWSDGARSRGQGWPWRCRRRKRIRRRPVSLVQVGDVAYVLDDPLRYLFDAELSKNPGPPVRAIPVKLPTIK